MSFVKLFVSRVESDKSVERVKVSGVNIDRTFKRTDRVRLLVLSERQQCETVVDDWIPRSDSFCLLIVLARGGDILQLKLGSAACQQRLLANLSQQAG